MVLSPSPSVSLDSLFHAITFLVIYSRFTEKGLFLMLKNKRTSIIFRFKRFISTPSSYIPASSLFFQLFHSHSLTTFKHSPNSSLLTQFIFPLFTPYLLQWIQVQSWDQFHILGSSLSLSLSLSTFTSSFFLPPSLLAPLFFMRHNSLSYKQHHLRLMIMNSSNFQSISQSKPYGSSVHRVQ